jgi:hypothetical protein
MTVTRAPVPPPAALAKPVYPFIYPPFFLNGG